MKGIDSMMTLYRCWNVRRERGGKERKKERKKEKIVKVL